MKLLSTVSLATVFMSGTLVFAQAKTTEQFRDWNVEIDANACSASSKVVDKSGTYTIQLKYDRKQKLPLEFFLKVDASGERDFSNGFLVNLKSLSQPKYFLAKLEQEGNSALYWGIPQNTSELLSYVLPGLRLVVNEFGSDLSLNFSLLGISKARKTIMENCNDGNELLDEAFEREFLTAKVKSIDLKKVSTKTVKELRALYFGGYGIYRRIGNFEKEIEELNSRYAQAIKNLADVMGLSKEARDSLQRLRSEIDTLQAAKIDFISRMLQARERLSSAIAQSLNAGEKFESAQSEFAAVKKEHRKLSSAVDYAKGQIADLEQAISANREVLEQVRWEIANVDTQISSLLQENSTSLDNIRQWDSEANTYQRRSDSFNVSAKSDWLLSQNSFVQSANNQLFQIDQQYNRYLEQLRQLRPSLMTLGRVAQEWGCARMGGRGGDRGDRSGGRGGRHQVDDDFDEDGFSDSNVEDCRRLRQHGRGHFQAQRELRNAIFNLEDRREEYLQYQQEARQYSEELASNFKYWLASTASEYRQSADQERQNVKFRGTEITRLSDRRSSLEQQLRANNSDSSLQNQLTQRNQELVRAQTALRNYESSSNYWGLSDRLAKAQEEQTLADQELSGAESNLKKVEAGQAKNKQAIEANQSNTERLLASIADLDEAKLNQDKILQPYFDRLDGTPERAGLKGQLAKWSDVYRKASANFSMWIP